MAEEEEEEAEAEEEEAEEEEAEMSEKDQYREDIRDEMEDMDIQELTTEDISEWDDFKLYEIFSNTTGDEKKHMKEIVAGLTEEQREQIVENTEEDFLKSGTEHWLNREETQYIPLAYETVETRFKLRRRLTEHFSKLWDRFNKMESLASYSSRVDDDTYNVIMQELDEEIENKKEKTMEKLLASGGSGSAKEF